MRSEKTCSMTGKTSFTSLTFRKQGQNTYWFPCQVSSFEICFRSFWLLTFFFGHKHLQILGVPFCLGVGYNTCTGVMNRMLLWLRGCRWDVASLWIMSGNGGKDPLTVKVNSREDLNSGESQWPEKVSAWLQPHFETI